MTEPLIDREALAHHITSTRLMSSWESADAVLDYLRSVLTPEALNPPGDVPVFVQMGDDWVKIENLLHRRIFGEDS